MPSLLSPSPRPSSRSSPLLFSPTTPSFSSPRAAAAAHRTHAFWPSLSRHSASPPRPCLHHHPLCFAGPTPPQPPPSPCFMDFLNEEDSLVLSLHHSVPIDTKPSSHILAGSPSSSSSSPSPPKPTPPYPESSPCLPTALSSSPRAPISPSHPPLSTSVAKPEFQRLPPSSPSSSARCHQDPCRYGRSPSSSSSSPPSPPHAFPLLPRSRSHRQKVIQVPKDQIYRVPTPSARSRLWIRLRAATSRRLLPG